MCPAAALADRVKWHTGAVEKPPDASWDGGDERAQAPSRTSENFVRGAELVLDRGVQIRLFGKLKLTHCARPEPRAGFFDASEATLLLHVQPARKAIPAGLQP
jgi:hypothetical protein